MRSILDRCMTKNGNAKDELLKDYREGFTSAIGGCHKIYDGDPFLLPPSEKGTRRISIALYDANMVALYRRKERINDLVQKREQICASIDDLLRTKLGLLTAKANTAQSIKDRIAEVGRVFDSVL